MPDKAKWDVTDCRVLVGRMFSTCVAMWRASTQRWGHTGLKQQGASSIIDGANHAPNFTVLRRSVWAGHAQVNAVGEEEGARARVIKLTPIVALDSFHRGPKLCAHIRKEVCQCGKGVRFNM